MLQQPKNTKQILGIMKQVIEKKTKEIILMLQRPRVNPYTKCKVIQPESPEGCDEMRAKETGRQMVKGEEEKDWDSEFMQGKAEWDIIKDFSNEGAG